MESKHILTVEEFKELARPTSKHIDDLEVITFIRECEDIFIIPAIGLRRYKALKEDVLSEENRILLEGGEYEINGDLKKCAGLQIALSYFVYAKMIMSDGGLLTRTGLMQHNDSYASRGDDKNRVRRYDEVMNVAEEYFTTCLAYIKAIEKKCDNGKFGRVRGTRIRIHSIGE
ncbi:MAG: hypothetical protein PUG96_02425 [Prevotellaceae bacterium]|nr:hypothetical protein [Prevotella sp.]MDD7272808.1 hypothetical protein [Prevotellaceae bacterium]